MKKTVKYWIALAFIGSVSIQKVSAQVTFNEEQATSDVKALLDPISNWIMGIGLVATLVSVGFSYLGYLGLDEATKEAQPFHKTLKKSVFGFVLFALTGVILKWFSIT